MLLTDRHKTDKLNERQTDKQQESHNSALTDWLFSNHHFSTVSSFSVELVSISRRN